MGIACTLDMCWLSSWAGVDHLEPGRLGGGALGLGRFALGRFGFGIAAPGVSARRSLRPRSYYSGSGASHMEAKRRRLADLAGLKNITSEALAAVVNTLREDPHIFQTRLVCLH